MEKHKKSRAPTTPSIPVSHGMLWDVQLEPHTRGQTQRSPHSMLTKPPRGLLPRANVYSGVCSAVLLFFLILQLHVEAGNRMIITEGCRKPHLRIPLTAQPGINKFSFGQVTLTFLGLLLPLRKAVRYVRIAGTAQLSGGHSFGEKQ